MFDLCDGCCEIVVLCECIVYEIVEYGIVVEVLLVLRWFVGGCGWYVGYCVEWFGVCCVGYWWLIWFVD